MNGSFTANKHVKIRRSLCGTLHRKGKKETLKIRNNVMVHIVSCNAH